MPIKIVAFVSVKEGSEDAFIAAAKVCVAASRAEPGVVHYELWREQQGKKRFVFNELYADQGAVDAHMASDHFKAFGLAARELASARPTIIPCDPIDSDA